MVINDKLKGDFYRAPITKLASRRNIENAINELIDYYNSIAQKLDECFDRISEKRIEMINKVYKMYEKVVHFKYVLDTFKLEVDQHIAERLNDTINSFQNDLANIVMSYEENLFKHNNTDSIISNAEYSNDEWEKSTNSLVSSLGIRWFGGKITNKSLIQNLNSMLRITKVNSIDKKNETSINSNLILEIFLYTKNGMAWLILGQNATFGYNLVTKYISEKMKMNMKIATEIYDTSKGFNLNVCDFDMVLNTLLTRDDIDNGDVYIKVKTNIPINSESGKEGYFISSSSEMNDYEYKRALADFSSGLLYHDNKDVGYAKQPGKSINDISNAGYIESGKSCNLTNAKSEKFEDFQFSTNENRITTEITVLDKNVDQKIYNPKNERMTITDQNVCGIIVSNDDASTMSHKPYFNSEMVFNKKYYGEETIKYQDGDNVVALDNNENVGSISFIGKNEHMGEIDINGEKHVVPLNIAYGTDLDDSSIENNINNVNINNFFENEIDQKFFLKDSILLSDDYSSLSSNLSEETKPIYPHLSSYDFDDIVTSDIFKHISYTYNGEEFFLFATGHGLFKLYKNKRITGSLPLQKITLISGMRVVYDIIVDPMNQILLATDKGIAKYLPESDSVVPFGIVSGTWLNFFRNPKTRQIMCISKDFSISTTDDKVLYNDTSVCFEALDYSEMLTIQQYSDNNEEYYSFEDPNDGNNIIFNSSSYSQFNVGNINTNNYYTDNREPLEYSINNHIKVLVDNVNNCYYMYRIGGKLLKSNGNVNDPITNFKNFHIVNSDFENIIIFSAEIFDNKLYFSGSYGVSSNNKINGYIDLTTNRFYFITSNTNYGEFSENVTLLDRNEFFNNNVILFQPVLSDSSYLEYFHPFDINNWNSFNLVCNIVLVNNKIVYIPTSYILHIKDADPGIPTWVNDRQFNNNYSLVYFDGIYYYKNPSHDKSYYNAKYDTYKSGICNNIDLYTDLSPKGYLGNFTLVTANQQTSNNNIINHESVEKGALYIADNLLLISYSWEKSYKNGNLVIDPTLYGCRRFLLALDSSRKFYKSLSNTTSTYKKYQDTLGNVDYRSYTTKRSEYISSLDKLKLSIIYNSKNK